MKNYPYSNSNCSVTNNNTQDCSLNNASMKNMHRSMNRNQLMEHINQVSFAVDEVKLYLDTHPCDSEALAYFHEMSAHRNDALNLEKTACGIPKRRCKVLRPPDPRYRRGLFGTMELDQ